MYRIASLNRYHDGRQFDSLAAAKAYADKHSRDGETVDVLALNDRDTWRAVYAGKGGNAGSLVRGTYEKHAEDRAKADPLYKLLDE